MAASDFIDQVQQVYIAYYGRPADPVGLQFWTEKLDEANGDLSAIIDAFGTSAEAESLFGGLSNEQTVNTLFNQLFGRDADVEGLLFYSNALANGTLTAQSIALDILNGAQNDDATIVANKLAVAKAFTDGLDTAAEIIAYSGDAAATTARELLATVDASTDTATFDVDTTIAAIEAADGGAVGTTFTLTAGADTVTGTSKNDTINALTVDADGDAAETFSAFDTIDGGAGEDTLNIFTTATENEAFSATTTVRNVETVNIFNTGAAADLADASNYEGVTALWQNATADAVTNLAATTTAGFRNTVQAADLDVTATAAASSITVALDNVADADTSDGNDIVLNTAGDSLASVTVSGSIAAGTDDPATQSLAIDITAGDEVTALTLNTAIDATLTITDADDDVVSIDASSSAGGVTFAGDTDVATLSTGAGEDDVTMSTVTVIDNEATAADETVTAVVSTGAADDAITINTSGTGATTVTAGAGDDTVTLQGDGSDTLTVDLGAGDDSFVVTTGAVAAGDAIDGGDGTDTLNLASVGAANIGAFSNFEVFDVVNMAADLDLDILATNNTVTEIVGSGALGANPVELSNLGAGVGFRATGSMGANELELTQKTAGDLTVTVDVDETEADDATDNNAVTVDATNATSVSAVFDTDNLDEIEGVVVNTQTLTLDTGAATSISVVSGGTESSNVLVLTDTSNDGDGNSVLTSITVTGDQAIDLSDITVTNTNVLAEIDASALTGDLTVDLTDLAEGATVKLGSGTDSVVTADNQGTTTATIESVEGFEAAASDAATDVAVADVIDSADALTIAADELGEDGTEDIEDGVVTFLGAGPATFADAVALVDAALTVDDSAALFEYVGNSYVFINDDTNGDTIIKLTGVTDVTELAVNGDDNLYII